VQKTLIERGWLGEKSGQGFYKRVGTNKDIHAIDLKTLEYHPAARVQFPAAEAARNIEDLPQRLRTLVIGPDRVGTFLWKLFSDVLVYSAERVPEISDRLADVDRAMRWGFAHKLGPFELWDALGFEDVCRRLEREGRALPQNVAGMRRAGVSAFYQDRGKAYFDFASVKYQQLEAPGLVLAHCRTVQKNVGASLLDLGDGVLCVEFHSKMNTLGLDQIQMLESGLAETARNFEATIIANQGDHFSAGANLMLILMAAQEADWDALNAMVIRFQQVNLAIKYAHKPVVAAPFGRTLGGGCEVALHACRIQAGAETYMGLVETGVGLIPAGGGSKELLLRLPDPRKAFEIIGGATVSSSGEHARNLGFLTSADRVSMNPDRLIGDAREAALALAKDYAPPPRVDLKVGGESAFAMMKLAAWTFRQGGYISDYDVTVGEQLARVLSGGRLSGEQTVPEQYLLDLEREAFLSLCGNPQTQERMQFMLKTGKPLRN
jgi:3-hydroxyacyl-CoA dehydrogenase